MSSVVAARPVPFVRRVRVKNYRSIATCDVTLGPLTVLVGFNASGKSNFLDVLRFVADALNGSLRKAVGDRGGVEALLYRTACGKADSFVIHLDVVLAPVMAGSDPIEVTYGFEVHRDIAGGGLGIGNEAIQMPGEDSSLSPRQAMGGPVTRLFLPLSSGMGDPSGALEAGLHAMRFYDLDSAVLGAPEDRVKGPATLGTRGEHLGQVLGELRRDDPGGKERFDAYLAALVPNLVSVEERMEGRFSTVEACFRAGERSGGEQTEVFLRESLSEGTLRAAGVLAALLQRPSFTQDISLIGIEEPEAALNPTGLGSLYEALDDAALRTQVIVTTQSPDLLDSEYARLEHLRVVSNVDGATRIGEVGSSGRTVVERGLMTISEVHRAGLMEPADHMPAPQPVREGSDER